MNSINLTDSTSPFSTSTVEIPGTSLVTTRQQFTGLPPAWLDFQPGSALVDLNYPEEVFSFINWYDDRNGMSCVKAQDAAGLTRHLYGDSVRLLSLGGRTRPSKGGHRKTTLSASESRLSRGEKRKLRRDRRELADDIL